MKAKEFLLWIVLACGSGSTCFGAGDVEAQEDKRTSVSNGDILHESEEYESAYGTFYLLLSQQSRNGENKMVLTCADDGPLIVAYLKPPEHYLNGSFDLIADGELFEPEYWEVVREPNLHPTTWVEVVVRPNPEQVQRLANADSVGARMFFPSGYGSFGFKVEDGYFGFEMTLRSAKLRNTLIDCRPSATAEKDTMVDFEDVDLRGGDILQNGMRDLSFQECKELCLAIGDCKAVSWMESKRWCWPKDEISAPSPAPGISSSIRK